MMKRNSQTISHQRNICRHHVLLWSHMLSHWTGSKQPVIITDDTKEVNDDGIYEDISIASISPAAHERQAGKTQDVDVFLEASETVCQPNGSFKNLHTCKKCPYIHPLPNWTVIDCCLRQSTVCITSDIMTCWQHIEANHAVILPSLLKQVSCLPILLSEFV